MCLLMFFSHSFACNILTSTCLLVIALSGEFVFTGRMMIPEDVVYYICPLLEDACF
jgi:hypothetical protein